MKESDQDPVDVGGLNRSEASFLAAVLRFGGGTELLDAIESGPARALRPRLEAVEPLGPRAGRKSARDLADVCRCRDGAGPISPVLRSDAADHLDALRHLDAPAFRRLAGRLGAFQLAELLREKNRRKVARVARRLEPARRQILLGALRRDRDCERRDQIHIREVFLSISGRVDDFAERIERLGLYTVACAAGLRYRERIAQLADRLPDRLGDRLRADYRLAREKARRGTGERFRDVLEHVLAEHGPGGDDDRR